jgi:flagellar FliJ protein
MAGKKFRFSLASVLKLRSYEAGRAQDRLARILREREVRAAELRAAEEHLERIGAEDTRSGTRGIGAFLRAESAWKQASEARDRARRALERLAAPEREARDLLAECMRKKDALEKLQEKELEAYLEEIRYSEQILLDEQGVIGFMKRRQEVHL